MFLVASGEKFTDELLTILPPLILCGRIKQNSNIILADTKPAMNLAWDLSED